MIYYKKAIVAARDRTEKANIKAPFLHEQKMADAELRFDESVAEIALEPGTHAIKQTDVTKEKSNEWH